MEKKEASLFERTGKKLWDFFASLKLSVLLFSLIIIASIAGSVLPDNKIAFMRFLTNKPQFVTKLFDFFEIYDLYASWWFILLIVLLGVNIVCCSFERLPGVLKIVRKKPNPPSVNKIKSLEDQVIFCLEKNYESVQKSCEKYLKDKKLRIYESCDDTSFSCIGEKGRWTRLGVYITHLGFLLLIIGGLFGSLNGFSGQINIVEGESEKRVNLFKNKGLIDLDFSVTCKSFKIIKYDNHNTPKSYESEIIFNKDKQDEYADIVKVNKPIRFNNIKFIQSGFGRTLVGPVEIYVFDANAEKELGKYEVGEGETITLPDGKTKFTLFSFKPNFHISQLNLGETFIGFIGSQEGESVVALPVNSPGFDKHRKGSFVLSPGKFETKNFTSLQVNKDPGVFLVYFGFLLLVLGCCISFFLTHRSYYVFLNKKSTNSCEVFFGVSSNKRKELCTGEPELFQKYLNEEKV